jgi:hypothetical protein
MTALTTPTQAAVRYLNVRTSDSADLANHDVYFNGERQKNCTEADVDKGFIRTFIPNECGYILTDKGRAKIVRKNGTVLIARRFE